MSKTSVKIEISKSKPEELTKLGNVVFAKHTALGAASPLNGLDMVTFGTKLSESVDKRAEAKKLHDQAEALNQQAGLSLGVDKSQNTKTPGTVYATLTSARDILLGLNRGQERKLSEWGFNVVINDVTKIKPEIPK